VVLLLKDLTYVLPIKLIIMFVLPIIAGNSLWLLYNVADTYVVGRHWELAHSQPLEALQRWTICFWASRTLYQADLRLQLPSVSIPKNMEGVRKSFATGIVLC